MKIEDIFKVKYTIKVNTLFKIYTLKTLRLKREKMQWVK